MDRERGAGERDQSVVYRKTGRRAAEKGVAGGGSSSDFCGGREPRVPERAAGPGYG